jgi:hypothetical protein
MNTHPSVPDQNSSKDPTKGPAQGPADGSTHAGVGVPEPPGEADLVVVHSPEDLVAAVPYLVGFPPEQSLVVVALRRSGRRQRLGMVARFDLPPVGPRRIRGEEGSAGAIRALVRQVVDVLRRDSPEQVVLLIYDDAPCTMVPVWQRLVTRLEAAFRAVDVPVMDAMHVAGRRFRSYRCTDPGCCPPEGRPLDPESSEVAAEFVARGSSPLASRAALHAMVQPREPEERAAAEAAAAVELGRLERTDHLAPTWRSWQTVSLRLVQQVTDRYAAGETGMDGQEAGRLLAALSDLPVRDAACLRFTAWPRGEDLDGDSQAGAGQDRAARVLTRMDELLADLPDATGGADDTVSSTLARDLALERFWLDLATSCDGRLALAPLTLLAIHVWSRGHGALAVAAVQRALAIDPRYRLAALLDQTLSLAVRPGGGRPRPRPNLRRVS